jgi:hypothetical protein
MQKKVAESLGTNCTVQPLTLMMFQNCQNMETRYQKQNDKWQHSLRKRMLMPALPQGGTNESAKVILLSTNN